MGILEIRGLSRWFSGLRALENILLDVDEGKVISIIGPNGAGKTTLFNCITGLIRPSAGEILFDGCSIVGLKPHKITSIGMARTFQSIRLFSDMTSLENVMVGGHSRTRAGLLGALFRPARVREEERSLVDSSMELLEFVGLNGKHDDMAMNLSYGDQRRLEIARAMNVRPRLLLLDEPAAGMNPSETAALVDLISEINRKGITVLLIEHDMKLVMEISDRVIVLDHGEKISEGSPVEVQKDQVVIDAYLGIEA